MSESVTSDPAPEGDDRADVPTAETPPEMPPVSPPPPHPAGRRRLTRSRDDRVIAGVCGGLAEHFGVDTVLVRIAALILLFAGGAGFLLYLIGWIAIPEGPADASAPAGTTTPTGERTGGAMALGLLFVAVGVFFLLDRAFPDLLAWRWIWPIALIAVGAIVIARARR